VTALRRFQGKPGLKFHHTVTVFANFQHSVTVFAESSNPLILIKNSRERLVVQQTLSDALLQSKGKPAINSALTSREVPSRAPYSLHESLKLAAAPEHRAG
jgi:hypothetical protein